MSAPRLIVPPGGGGGGGTVTGTGTPGTLAKFTGTGTSIGNSLLSESGTTITSAAAAEVFGSPQTWTLPGNASGLTIKSSAGNSTFVLSTYSGGVGINVGSGGPGTLLDISDGSGYAFAGSTYEGVRLLRGTEALFSSSDGTRSFRAGITGSTAVVGTSTAHDLLLQRGNVTAATLQSGAIATVTLAAGGTGYTSATYSQQALTGGTGTGATADVVVAGGIVTSCVLRSPGSGYTAADALSCATIGAGAGFVLTVATIAQIVAGSGNVTALGRIGAGTATPRAALDAVGGSMLSGMQLNALWNSAAGVPNSISYTALQIDNSLSASNTFVIPAGLAGGAVRGINAYLRVDASNVASGTSYNYGAAAQISLAETGPGAISGYGGFFSAAVNTTGLSGKTILQLYGTSGQILVQAAGGTNTFSDAAVFFSSHSVSATTVQNFTKYSTFNGASAGSFSGAAHVVTNYYGIQLGAPSLSNGSTITNRWGISQEDTLASNYFAGNVGCGSASPTANLQVTQGTSGVGTVSNSAAGTTVTGSSTQFLNTFKTGDTITIGGQTVAITAIASNTSMTTAAITSANSGVGYTLVGGTRFSAFGNGNVSISTGSLTVRTVANPNSYTIVAQDDVAIYTATDASGTTNLRLASSTSMPQGAALIKATKTAAGAATLTFQTAAGGALADQAKIDSAGVFSFNSGFGSLSTAYGCRAWVNFNGTTTITIRASGGISSITRASAGNYTINYTAAMPDINYSAVATKQSNTLNVSCQLYDYIASRATTSSTWVNVENAAIVDSANINIAFFR